MKTAFLSRGVAVGLVAGLAAFLAIGPLAASAKENVKVPDSKAEVTLSYAPVVKKVAPAVVNIYARRVVKTQGFRSPLFNDPFFQRFFGGDLGAPQERVQNSLGSGVIVGARGTVVTNHHVIKDASEITVVLHDRREYHADIVLADDRADLAVLKLKDVKENLPALAFGDSEALEVGDLVLAVGNPFGVGQTVTSGIVSALARTQVGVSDYQFFIQTDAAINPGNSGGALVDMAGNLVGINTAIFSRSGGSVGIGFAIPSAMVKTVVATAATGGPLKRPWLGASGQPVGQEMADGLGLNRPGGVLVNDIWPFGPADKAGLRVGDVIRQVGRFEVFDMQGLRYRLASASGTMVKLHIWRDGADKVISLPLQAPPSTPSRNEAVLEGQNPFNGVKVANLNPAYADELGRDPMVQGVMIVEVDRRSYAARLGLRPGDIVANINGTTINVVRELKAILQSNKGDWEITIDRDGRLASFKVRAN